VKSKPFSEVLTTRIEFMNEFIIFLNYSFLCMFTEVYGTDLEKPSNEFLEARQNIGFFLISTLGLIISVNMSIAFKDIFIQVCGVLKQVIEKIKEKLCFKKVEKVPGETVQTAKDQ
jgi:hypothetical protein